MACSPLWGTSGHLEIPWLSALSHLGHASQGGWLCTDPRGARVSGVRPGRTDGGPAVSTSVWHLLDLPFSRTWGLLGSLGYGMSKRMLPLGKRRVISVLLSCVLVVLLYLGFHFKFKTCLQIFSLCNRTHDFNFSC